MRRKRQQAEKTVPTLGEVWLFEKGVRLPAFLFVVLLVDCLLVVIAARVQQIIVVRIEARLKSSALWTTAATKPIRNGYLGSLKA